MNEIVFPFILKMDQKIIFRAENVNVVYANDMINFVQNLLEPTKLFIS